MAWHTPRTHKTRISRSKHATVVMKLRLEGLSHKEIGARLGVSEQRAWRICDEELKRLNLLRTEAAEQVQRLELDRLDTLLQAVWKDARKGDFRSIDRVLRIMERRASLLGLDLVRHEVKVEHEHAINISQRIDEYAAELQLEAGPRALPCPAAGDGSGESLDQANADADAKPVPKLRGAGGNVRRRGRRR
jgi:hypothetical protein